MFVEDMDRISELPLHIIHQIMSHLSRKEVAQTSFLSKSWKNNLRPSFPILAFNHEDFAAIGLRHEYSKRFRWGGFFVNSPEKFMESMEAFTTFVDATLENFCQMNLRMQKFELCIGIPEDLDFDHWSPIVDDWIRLALEHQVKDLDLGFLLVEKGLYPLPETVFFAKSITRLSLRRCYLDHPAALRFHSLRNLILMEVCLDELMIHRLTGDSPLLGFVSIVNCWGFEHCHLRKLARLETLVIDFSHPITSHAQVPKSIEIEAPNLRNCTIDCYNTVGAASSISGLFNCQCLRKLNLRDILIKDEADHGDTFSKIFPLLEELKVNRCSILRRITIANQRLKQLSLCGCEGLKAIQIADTPSLEKLKISQCLWLEAIHIDAPNLREFIFTGHLVPTASINAPCPGEFYVYNLQDVDTLWYLNLKKFLLANAKHKSLSVDIRLDKEEHSYDPEEFRGSSFSPPCEMQNLDLCVQMPESDYAALLDGFFSVCYPQTLSCYAYQSKEFCMWLYHEILAQRDAYRCDCSYVHCWRHYLKGIIEIKIEPHRSKDTVVLEPDALLNAGPDDFPDGRIDFALDWCF